MDSQEYENQSWTKVCLRQDRYSIEIQVESLFRDKTASCVRIVNGGINKYVTESMETKEEEGHSASVRLVVKARPQVKPAVTLSSACVPLRKKVDRHQS